MPVKKSNKIVELEKFIEERLGKYSDSEIYKEASAKFGLNIYHAKSTLYKYKIKKGLRTELGKARLEKKHKFKEDTDTNQYNTGRKVLTALDNDGNLMDIETYCAFYKIPFEQARTYKLVTHTGVPYYNIASNVINDDEGNSIEIDELRKLIKEDLSGYKFKIKSKNTNSKKINVIKISDLHFGSYVKNLIKTHDYSISILAEKLEDAANIINEQNASENHIHILGDLIESFTGTNKKNTWQWLENNLFGAEVVKLCCKVLHDNFLSKIDNLRSVKIVAGNHDRITSDKESDLEGGAANLIAWGLGLMGYDIEFNPIIIKHEVDNICYINTHGHHALSKLNTTDICWKYGNHGKYNLITEGHLHNLKEKKRISNISVIKDDSDDSRRIICPSIFTGNFYSESLGFSNNSGFLIFNNNGKGNINMLSFTL